MSRTGRPSVRGKFITFEGGEGSGKSTQARLLAEALRQSGVDAQLTREPGGSPGAEQIRKLLTEGDGESWDAMEEALLLFAARRAHLRRTIIPALNSGKWVICDRYMDSTRAYQGGARGLGFEVIERLAVMALGPDSPIPDATLILDLDVSEGLARAASRGGRENRFELLGADFHQKLRDAFLL
ncbi:MAG TPA: dTMP kinase, partial [Alphaproteobacteria bacterium]|nr:dTMP kinase [Alphaproteobacteria bacterium]